MDIEQTRLLFPIITEDNTAYFASCSYGPLCKPVKQAVLNYIVDWEKKGANWDYWMEKYEELRREAALLLGANVDEIAIVPNVSSGLAIIASSLRYDKGKNEILLSDLNFPTVGHIWGSQRRHGARVEIIESKNWIINLEDLRKKINNNTLVVSEPHVCYQSGFMYDDLKALAELAHRHGALLVIDDAQATGVVDIDVKRCEIDVLVTTTSKYLLGGAGVGILYVRRDIIEELEPTLTGWFSRENPFKFDIRDFSYAKSARRFETGTPSLPTLLTSLEGIKLIREVEVKSIENHVRSLVSYAIQEAQELKLDILSPLNSSNVGPMLAIKVSNPARVSEVLLKYGIVVAPRGPAIRVCVHMFNTRDEIDRLYSVFEAYVANRL